MTKRPNKMQAFGANMAKIAQETTREIKAKPVPVDEITPAPEQLIPPVPEGAAEVDPVTAVEAMTAQPHEAAEPEIHEAVEPKPHRATKPAPVKRTSTSLYLSPAAHKVLRIHAAKLGVRSNRIYEDALRDYFEKEGLGNFDKINKTAP